jgi:hypothetical protein
MGKLDGRCLCGTITYSCDAEPVATALCHCRECQRQTGTAFSVVVGVPLAALDVQGDTLATFTTVGDDHGKDTERRFCKACGSPIVSVSGASPDIAFIKAGTLDDTSWLDPQIEVWGSSAHEWLEPVEGRPRLARGPGG